jgi:hypothetical protein
MSAQIKTIDGREYAFSKIPPTKSVPLQVQLLKLVGPEVQILLGQKTGFLTEILAAVVAEKDPAKQFQIVSDALKSLAPFFFGVVQNADGDQVLEMMELVFSFVAVDGRGIQPNLIDATFAQCAPGTMWKVFWEGLRVNYASFFRVAPSDSSAPKTT